MNTHMKVFKDEFEAEVYCMGEDEIDKKKSSTKKQKDSMRRWERLVAAELRRQKVDMRDFLSKPVYADEDIVHKYMWLAILKAITDGEKTSSKQQTTKEALQIQETLNKLFAEGVGGKCEPFHIEWPSDEPPMLGNP